MVSASLEAIITGSSASLILITAYTTAIFSFIRAKKIKNPFLNWVGGFLICMGSFYLGIASSFITLLITGQNLDTYTTGYLSYSVTPIGVAIAMYVGFKLISSKPKVAVAVATIFALSGLVFWYYLYVDHENSIFSNVIQANIDGDLIDLTLEGLVNILITVYLASFAVILIPGYIWLAKISTGSMRKNSILLVIGYTLFIVCGYIDTRVPATVFVIMIVRIVMAIAYIFLFLGFTRE
jgi:hypothetical protein